ncbi:MAG TPA: aminotransferase class V-fold PLP-dependent enzyme [Polyangiaceae bacterium]|nr:aminotransferase class V-fold PLP-dependent enzyme [Polyangiaceae bacterium]
MTDATFALGDLSLYPDLKAKAYLAYAATAPVSRLVKAAVNQVLDAFAERGNVAFFEFLQQRERLRGRLASLVGGRSEDIALIAGTTRGISDLALCLRWQPQERVVLFDGEFPANVTPWQRAAQLFGLRLDFVPMTRAVDDEESFLKPLEALLEKGARLVTVSAVQFQTGLRMPLHKLGALCQKHGAELCVDAIQACGVVPLDVQACGIDYLVSGSHKWLLGPEGVGFLYAKPERAKALVPRTAGWLSHQDGTRFLFSGPGELRYDRPLKDDVTVLEGGSSSTLGFAGLDAAIEPLLALTPATILTHVGRYLDVLEPAVEARGFRSLRAREPERRSGIASFTPPVGISAVDLVMQLRERGVFASMPDGLLRFAPHFPNSVSEIETVLGALDEALLAMRNR